jgi:hypothetical protein
MGPSSCSEALSANKAQAAGLDARSGFWILDAQIRNPQAGGLTVLQWFRYVGSPPTDGGQLSAGRGEGRGYQHAPHQLRFAATAIEVRLVLPLASPPPSQAQVGFC